VISLPDEPQPSSLDDIPPYAPPGRHYERAPIAEAIIEVRCELAPEVTLDDLAKVADSAQFTAAGPAIQISGRVEVSQDGIKGDTSGQQIGHVFRRNDGLRLIQSRLNGFSYSILPPYERWETFCSEAWAAWLEYQRIIHPLKATRLGVRYVNRIDVPQNIIEIKDYLRTAIDISPYLPQMMAGYFMQAVVPLPRFNATATITSTVVPPPSPDFSSLILDIDTWRDIEISFDLPGANEDIRTQLEALREAKNQVFEACITDATRGLISLCLFLSTDA
jgi:uncharacterized protein (TIGR04255 family)